MIYWIFLIILAAKTIIYYHFQHNGIKNTIFIDRPLLFLSAGAEAKKQEGDDEVGGAAEAQVPVVKKRRKILKEGKWRKGAMEVKILGMSVAFLKV